MPKRVEQTLKLEIDGVEVMKAAASMTISIQASGCLFLLFSARLPSATCFNCLNVSAVVLSDRLQVSVDSKWPAAPSQVIVICVYCLRLGV